MKIYWKSIPYQIHEKLKQKDWSGDVVEWPRVNIGQVFWYILTKKAFDTEYISQYKAKKAFSYFKSGFIHELLSKTQNEMKITQGKVTQSQKFREAPKAFGCYAQKMEILFVFLLLYCRFWAVLQ